MLNRLKREPLPPYEPSKPMAWYLMRLRTVHERNMQAIRSRRLVMIIVASVAVLAAIIPFALK